ncbi:lysophospholipid acyltransferase family protein [Thiococcus pfennigii]|uniref:lysophospholipid acyltransferase family protein n=1 Tax=Thiococcus pfennigii TaxID=1057 RepID=UPI001904496C|nr:lysophospholipid acyltransferase family protein [Thiococcus pfennigii]MBK1732126.1 1-acyl-sn-glycerol-3-phosphate acyltransferase [Thiococcus pfennigii]
MPHATRTWRLLRLAATLIAGLAATLAIAAGERFGRRPRTTPRVVRWWHGRVCRDLGLRVEVIGTPLPNALLVVNHVSWLDIPALGAQGEIDFLSKAEVRDWPVVGWMATVAGTLFIERGAHQTAGLAEAIGARVRAGRPVAIFPEGTTSDGTALLRFHPRLFASGQQAGVVIQPVALRYGTGPAPDPIAPFIGRDTLLAHLARVLGHGPLDVRIQFLAPIDPSQTDRRQLAAQARAAIARALGLTGEHPPRIPGEGAPCRETPASARRSLVPAQ